MEENFADYILNERDIVKKMQIVYFLMKREGIYYDNSVILKTQIAKMFIEIAKIDVDENLVLTACLLYACKKKNIPQPISKIKAYAIEGTEYLKSLGFSDRFCKICIGHNRYNDTGQREPESDILELVDQFRWNVNA